MVLQGMEKVFKFIGESAVCLCTVIVLFSDELVIIQHSADDSVILSEQ